MSHDNGAIVQRWFEEIWNERRPDTIDELLTAESVCYTDDGPMIGPEEFKARQYLPFIAAFPDLRVTLEAMVVEGEKVIVRWTATGTHAGDGVGHPPTHRPVHFVGMSWIHVRGGKLMEGWQNSNITDVITKLASPLPT